MSKILGIDPSMTGCGLAIIESETGKLVTSRIIKTSPERTRGDRLSMIAAGVTSVASEYRVSYAAMEGYAMGKMFNRELMGEVGGVIKMVMHGFTVEPVIWAPGSWRKALFGNGHLPKDQIRLSTYQRYGVDIKDINELEAFCVAYAEYMALNNIATRPRPKKKKLPEE